MTSITQKSNVALPTTTSSGYTEGSSRVPASPATNPDIAVITIRRNPTKEVQKHVGRGRSVAEVVAAHESNPRRAAAIRRARQRLAEHLETAGAGQSLGAMRLAKGLSQAQLADAVGVMQPYIARLEKGKESNPKARIIKKLRIALGVTADQILDALPEEEIA